jgi:hypothetical protein
VIEWRSEANLFDLRLFQVMVARVRSDHRGKTIYVDVVFILLRDRLSERTGDGPGYMIASIERPGPSRLRARHGQARDHRRDGERRSFPLF